MDSSEKVMSWFDASTSAQPPLWRNKDGESILDIALREIGIDPTQGKMQRPEEPPSECVVLNTSVQIPYDPPPRNSTGFPFEISVSQRMAAPERLAWQKDCVDRLIACYEHELEQVDALTVAHNHAVERASNVEKRKLAYFSYLASLMHAPPQVFRANISRLMSMRKLWKNRALEWSRGARDLAEQCCNVRGCPHVAIHGSRFCGWHILNDTRQQLFTRCTVCGAPRLKNIGMFECAGHKPRRSKSKPKDRPAPRPRPRVAQKNQRQRSRSTPK